jgi:uncharacterized membrane protein
MLDEVITIGQPREELYRFLRELHGLPRIAPRLLAVTSIDDRRSLWRVQGPAGIELEWRSEITADEPGHEIAWRTTRGGAITHFGCVRFFDAVGDRGTLVYVHLEYVPLAGALGTAIARLAGPVAARNVRAALRCLKQLAETGEIATTAGQPAGAGRSPLAKRLEGEQARGSMEPAGDER